MWLHERGGWKDRGIVDALARHATIVSDELHEYIDDYFLVNEPFQCTLTSYHLGEHAPGERSLAGGFLAVHHALLAQAAMFRILKECDPDARVSTVYNARPFYAASTSPEDLHAALLASQYQTRIFTDPLYLGKYPEELQSHFKEQWPRFDPSDLSAMRIGDGLHAFGLNYYRGQIISSAPGKELPWEEVRYPRGTVNGLGWPVFIPPVYPEGFTDILCELYHRYSSHGMKRIIITENGACALDQADHDGIIHDQSRIAYVEKHLEQLLKAILGGVPVEGYFLWTLLDNYEWDQGYRPGSQFGIVHVDRTTQVRTPKESYGWYRDVVRNKKLPSLEEHSIV